MPLRVALLLKPGADGLEGAISTAPAIIIHVVLHVVVVAVDPLDQVHLEKDTSRLLNLTEFISVSIFERRAGKRSVKDFKGHKLCSSSGSYLIITILSIF